jgi:mono/diheme cytochrome c family protein
VKRASTLPLLLGSLLVVPMLAFSQNGQSRQSNGADDSDTQVMQGRALYHGDTLFSRTARIGSSAATSSPLPAKSAACVGCHGPRGDAAREAGINIPGIRWQQLRASTATQPAYASHDAIAAAIEHARGRVGFLAAPMPQYALTDSERSALLAYLRVLGTDSDKEKERGQSRISGVSGNQILIGAILPLQGNLRALGETIQQELQARVDFVNRQGGVFGRSLTLIVEDVGATPESASEAMRRLAHERGIFAFVGSYVPDDAMLDGAVVDNLATPFVAMLGVPLRSTQNRRVTYLMPSIEQQLALHWSQLSARCNISQGVDVFHAPVPGLTAAIRDSAKKAGLDNSADALSLREIRDHRDFTNPTVNKSVRARSAVALVDQNTLNNLRAARHSNATGVDQNACLGSLAIFSGTSGASDAYAASSATDVRRTRELITLPMPPILHHETASTKDGLDLWRTLADVAMRTFVEALSRTGRDVDHARFERALMSLQRFEPIAGLSLDFSPQQRHGFTVSSIWKGNSHEHAQ